MKDDQILDFEEFKNYLKENRTVPKYDATGERKHPHVWWDIDHTGLNAILRDIAMSVTDLLTRTPERDTELVHLKTLAEALPQVQHGPPVKVALLGTQGAGKSLLINALFGVDGLSLTGADGAACTSAVIEYVQYPSGHGTNAEQQFLAEIRFLSATKCEEMIKEHARNYRHYDGLADSDDESDKGSTSKAKAGRQDALDRRLRDTAEEIFQTLFGGKEQFLASWNGSANMPGIFVKTCQLKCKEAISNLDITSDNIVPYVGRDAKDLIRQIRPFMTKVKGEVSLWPLVDRISIRFNSPLLEQRTIIDLPGWGDINLSRARQADDIKDTVDVELIVADTIRIGTDDAVINNARSGISNHGARNVKLVATKVDQISRNQLEQCTGQGYDDIKNCIAQVDAELTKAEEEDDPMSSDQLGKYKTYLERKLKQKKVQERAKDISTDLAMKLDGRTPEQVVECFHVSASEYMTWISKDRITFKDQPALTPELTGIPAIRQFLYDLPADSNYQALRRHAISTLPAFLEKIRRIVTDTDRDVGFHNIADDFDLFREKAVTTTLTQCKHHFRKINAQNLAKSYGDGKPFKQHVDNLLKKDWLTLKAPAWNRIVKSRGTVPPGVSKAKGLENGSDWNKDLADILAPALRKWYTCQMAEMKKTKHGLRNHFDGTYNHVLYLMNKSPAGFGTIEKAKQKWTPYRIRFLAQSDILMETIEEKLTLLVRRATLEDSRQNNFIASITDDPFDEIFNSAPARKTTTSGKQAYVSPKLKFQKTKLNELFLDPSNHFADMAMKKFQAVVDSAIEDILNEHIGRIAQFLTKFSDMLRSQAPVSYTITQTGENIRADLRGVLPNLEEKAMKLRDILPVMVKNEGDAEVAPCEFSETQPSINPLSFYLDNAPGKRKESGTKIKQEPGTKKIRTE